MGVFSSQKENSYRKIISKSSHSILYPLFEGQEQEEV